MTLEYHSSLQLRDVTSSSYLSLPAAENVDRLWSNCLSDTKPAPWPSTMTTGLGVTFLQGGQTGFAPRNLITDCDLEITSCRFYKVMVSGLG